MSNFKTILFIITVLSATTLGCKKEYDSPPENTIPTGSIINISELRGLYQGTSIKFVGDTSVYGVVTADESSGNLYKEFYFADGSGAINVRILSSGGIYQGDSIRINIKGGLLSMYNNMLQLDSIDVDQNIIKQATNVAFNPTTTTIDMLNPAFQGHLVRLENVEFSSADLGSTYADATNQVSANKTLVDCNGNSILLRTSGYANFADNAISSDNGSIIAIVGVYNSDLQLYIRDINEVAFSDPRCSAGPVNAILVKNFDDGSVTSGGWTNYNVSGAINWETSTAGGAPEPFGNISNYNGSGNDPCETWLISPAVDLSGATNPSLTFENAYSYIGDPLELYISTNYDGSSDPSTATWTQLSFTLSTGFFSWVSSGAIDLSTHQGSATYIGFKYIGGSTDGSTWELDDIIIQ